MLDSHAITPPPPSAPSEFLDSQWLDGASTSSADGSVEASLTPPPPSAPFEFLHAQWSDGQHGAEQPQETDPPDFAAAKPVIVEGPEHLERLAEVSEPAPDGATELEGDGAIEGTPEPIRIRGVPFVPGEEISRVFLPNEGMVDSVPRTGQVLILTNRRLIAFRGVEGFRDTHIADSSEIAQCSVRTGQRNWGAVMQGAMIMVGGAFLYLIVGYWLAGQVSGPNVPVLNIDVAPLIALLIVLAGMFILASNYFTRPAGAVIFHGEGMEIAFPFRSSLDVRQVYDLVDQAQSPRNRANSSRSGETVELTVDHRGQEGPTWHACRTGQSKVEYLSPMAGRDLRPGPWATVRPAGTGSRHRLPPSRRCRCRAPAVE